MTVVCGNFHLSEIDTDTYHNTAIIMDLLGLQAKVSALWAVLWPRAFTISYPEVGGPRADDQNLSTTQYLGGLFTAFSCRCEASES